MLYEIAKFLSNICLGSFISSKAGTLPYSTLYLMLAFCEGGEIGAAFCSSLLLIEIAGSEGFARISDAEFEEEL